MSCLARRRGVVALVHHVHREQWHIIYPGWRGRLGWWIESRLTPWLYRDIEHVTVSESSRRDLIALGIPAARIHLAHNGLDRHASLPGSHAPARISVLSRLVPHKQIDHAFGVVRELSRTHPDVVLDVIGDGWWRDELVRSARDLGVSDRVVFHGRVPASRRDQILADSALMLLPSVKEGWGLAIMEAAMQGTPTIAYRSAGGVTESIIDGETGMLVDDPAQLADATDRLLSDQVGRERLSEAARRHASRFTWTATATAFERVVELVSRRR
jgi:glycosyltransferase involved in cell wall biosynthesis